MQSMYDFLRGIVCQRKLGNSFPFPQEGKLFHWYPSKLVDHLLEYISPLKRWRLTFSICDACHAIYVPIYSRTFLQPHQWNSKQHYLRQYHCSITKEMSNVIIVVSFRNPSPLWESISSIVNLKMSRSNFSFGKVFRNVGHLSPNTLQLESFLWDDGIAFAPSSLILNLTNA